MNHFKNILFIAVDDLRPDFGKKKLHSKLGIFPESFVTRAQQPMNEFIVYHVKRAKARSKAALQPALAGFLC